MKLETSQDLVLLKQLSITAKTGKVI